MSVTVVEMKFLSIFIVIAVCGIHVTTAAPKPKIDIGLRDDVRAVLRHILLKGDQTTLDQWLGLDRDSEEDVPTTKPAEQEDERLTTLLTLITEGPELFEMPPPAPQRLIIHPLCMERLNNPHQIKDINDIQNPRDVLEYLIYRLCLPTVTAEDVLAVSDIVDRLSSPGIMPVIGLPNPFVPEVQTLVPEVQTLAIDIDLLPPDIMPAIGIPNPFVPELQTLVPEVQTLSIDIDLLPGLEADTDLDSRPVIGPPNPFVPEVQTLVPEVQTLSIDIDLLPGEGDTDFDSRPVIGPPNPFVPEVQTLTIDIDLLQEEAVTYSDQELDDQEMPRTQVNDFDPDINDDINDDCITTIVDDDEKVTQLEESDDDNGILKNFLLQVDRTFTTWFHLKRQEEEDEDEEGNTDDVNIFEEPFLAAEEPVVSTDAAYLMPVTEEPSLNPLCRDRLNNPDQIENIADVQNRYDVIDYLIYRLCLPSATAEDVEAVATIVEQLSWPVEVKPKPMFDPYVEPVVEPDVEPEPVIEPEVHTSMIDIDLSQEEDGAVMDQEPATKPLDDQKEAVTQAAPLDSDNDTDNDEADDIQLMSDDTTSALSNLDQSRTDSAESSEKIEENTQKNMQKNRPADQEQGGAPTSSTSAESDEDDDEENDAAQPLDIDLDELELRIREFLDSFLN